MVRVSLHTEQAQHSLCNRFYMKRWNMQAGSAEFGEFAPVNSVAVPENQQEQQGTAFASLQDLQILKDMVDKLQAEIDRLKKPAGKTVKKNDASNDE